ncbi:MAG: hypothetical protein IT211_14020 [Armatimonadetes bacterium]|nr:hypothetical protein [Armatimonadota bacterium]
MITRLMILPLLLLALVAATTKAQPTDSAAIATKLFAAIRNADWKGLRALLPPVNVIRAVAPTETNRLKSKQLTRQMEQRVRAPFDEIVASAKKKNVTLNTLEFVRFQTSRPWEGANRPIGLEIFYGWQGREGSLGFSVMEYQGRWYLLEILRSANIFDKVTTQ